MWSVAKALLRIASRAVGLTLLATVLSAAIISLTPGYGIDERELDSRLSAETVATLRHEQQEQRGVFANTAKLFAGLIRFDLGYSKTLQRPVSELLRERGVVTIRLVGAGLGLGWGLGFVLGLFAGLSDRRLWSVFGEGVSQILLSIPPAVLALLLFAGRLGASLGIAAVVAPKVFAYTRALVAECRAMPFVIQAKARGVARWRTVACHILKPQTAPLLSVFAISSALAFNAAVPIEVFCNEPGVGQLAWQSAMGRDLPVLVSLTMIVALATAILNELAGSLHD